MILTQSFTEQKTIAMPTLENALQTVLDKTVDNKKIFGTCFSIKKENFTWNGASGDLSVNQPYYIASTTKLFTTALILQLKSSGKIDLEDNLSTYFEAEQLEGLHKFKGTDYSNQITVKQLLAHTSGIPDYFQDKTANGRSLEDELKSGNDQSWSFEESLERSKKLTPLFAPDTKTKAHYSDTNYQLLGKIIEIVTNKSYSENCDENIINPLGLKDTYLYKDLNDYTPKNLYYKSSVLEIPKAMTSFGPDGGMVSTSSEMLVFIEAFFTGKLFPINYIHELKVWNKIFFPIQSGIGIHLFKLPWIFNPTGVIPYFMGHSGLSGALAYFSPTENLYISGTVNQLAYPETSFKTMVKLTQKVLKG